MLLLFIRLNSTLGDAELDCADLEPPGRVMGDSTGRSPADRANNSSFLFASNVFGVRRLVGWSASRFFSSSAAPAAPQRRHTHWAKIRSYGLLQACLTGMQRSTGTQLVAWCTQLTHDTERKAIEFPLTVHNQSKDLKSHLRCITTWPSTTLYIYILCLSSSDHYRF